MKESSVNALLVLSIILIIPGTAIMSPDGRIFFLALAGICAAVAAIGGKGRVKRITAVLIIAVVLGLSLATYSEHRISYEKYKGAAGRHK